MYKNIFLLMCSFVFLGCSEENEDPGYYTAPEDTAYAAPAKRAQINVKYLEGLSYTEDSIALEALFMANKVELSSICEQLLENILEKDLHIVRQDQNRWAFEVSKEDMDSLKYYGFSETDISHTNDGKPIYVAGSSPYKEKGLWETVHVRPLDYGQHYPVLYAVATKIFLQNHKPVVRAINITDQSSKYVDYNAEFEFEDGQDVYVDFTIRNVGKHIEVTLNKENT